MSALPLVPAARPTWTGTIPRQAVLAAVGVLFLAAFAQVEIPNSFAIAGTRVELGPVPITGQTFAVLLLGFAYGSRLSLATLSAYLLAGTAGLPFFAGGGSGISTLTGATGGYLIGFAVAATLTGFLAERGWHTRHLTVVAGMLLGSVAITVLGYLWLAFWFTTATGGELATAAAFGNSWEFGVQPFLVGDAVKVALATAFLPSLARQIGTRD